MAWEAETEVAREMLTRGINRRCSPHHLGRYEGEVIVLFKQRKGLEWGLNAFLGPPGPHC